jgi:hypothetical protein
VVDAGEMDGGAVDGGAMDGGDADGGGSDGGDTDGGGSDGGGSDGGGTDGGVADGGSTCGNGVVDTGETCDPSVSACCNASCDGFATASTECRTSAGPCDVAETCTGASDACPADALEPSTTVCRAATDACDAPETCTGAGAACPADAFEPATTVCRVAADDCDAAETCTGTGAACPADVTEPNFTACMDCPTTSPSCGGCYVGMCLDAGVGPLLISEYVEGSSNNKALELFSATGIDLSACEVRRYSNGTTTPTSIALSGTLAAGSTYVICNPLISDTSSCDLTSAILNHNGDDAYDLFCDGAVLDTFGQIGVDPGAEWAGSGVSTLNQTLRRKCAVTAGDTNGTDVFDPSVEYDGVAVDDFTGLGTRGCP